MDQVKQKQLLAKLDLACQELEKSIEYDDTATDEDLARLKLIKAKLLQAQSMVDPRDSENDQTPELRAAEIDSLLEEISSVTSEFSDLENELGLV